MQTFKVEVSPIVMKGIRPTVKRAFRCVTTAAAVVEDLREKGTLPKKAFIIEIVKGRRKLDRIRVTVKGDSLTITPLKETK